DHLAENSVLIVEKRRRTQSDVELRARGIGIAGASHGNHAGRIVPEFRLYFKRDRALAVGCRIDEATGAIAFGISSLDDESGFVAVEGQPVVEAALHKIEKIAGCDWRFVLEDFNLDGALAGIHYNYRVCCHFTFLLSSQESAFVRVSGLWFVGSCAQR